MYVPSDIVTAPVVEDSRVVTEFRIYIGKLFKAAFWNSFLFYSAIFSNNSDD